MKVLGLIFLTMLFGKGCEGEQKQDLASAVLTYEANTRGFYQKVTIQNQMVTVSKNRNGADGSKANKISDAQWKSLVTEFGKISLEGLPNLKAPTEKRFYDGAAIANLTVIYKGQTYESAAFDHGEPPSEIAELINKIVSISKE